MSLAPDLSATLAWRTADQLEEKGFRIQGEDATAARSLYLDCARRFGALAGDAAASAQAHWRSARCYWLAGESLDVGQVEERVEHYERARDVAARGIDLDPQCAECMLWKFSSMGRLGTTRGLWGEISSVAEMAELLDRAIALEPTSQDSEWNSTLGNLYYASAIFYRVVPDWFWMSWLMGVRGDKERALSDARTALSIHPMRLDYRIEVGSQLLCLGATKEQEKRLAEGRRILEEALSMEPANHEEAHELRAARIMLDAPERSCGYTGDTWMELDEQSARANAP